MSGFIFTVRNYSCGPSPIPELCPLEPIEVLTEIAISRERISLKVGTLVSPTNETDHNDIPEILLKVALNTIALIPNI
jgi:hypothetical protein